MPAPQRFRSFSSGETEEISSCAFCIISKLYYHLRRVSTCTLSAQSFRLRSALPYLQDTKSASYYHISATYHRSPHRIIVSSPHRIIVSLHHRIIVKDRHVQLSLPIIISQESALCSHLISCLSNCSVPSDYKLRDHVIPCSRQDCLLVQAPNFIIREYAFSSADQLRITTH